MFKSIPSVAILGSILEIIQRSGVQLNPNEYPFNIIIQFANMSFMMGALMIKLEPARLKFIDKEVPQHEPYTMRMEKDLVERVEQARNIEGIITSEPYMALVYSGIDDAVQSGKQCFDYNLTITMACLCFQRGSIFGSIYPERIEPMFRADYPLPNTFPWEDLVDSTKTWLKRNSFY